MHVIPSRCSTAPRQAKLTFVRSVVGHVHADANDDGDDETVDGNDTRHDD